MLLVEVQHVSGQGRDAVPLSLQDSATGKSGWLENVRANLAHLYPVLVFTSHESQITSHVVRFYTNAAMPVMRSPITSL